MVFGRKVLRRIFGPKNERDGTWRIKTNDELDELTFRHRASCILGQVFHYSPENAFYIFNQQIYFII